MITLLSVSAQLSSVPSLEQERHKESNNVEKITSKVDEIETRKADEPDNSETRPKDEEEEIQSAAKDPRYEKYFKMLHFGVPKQAFKLKMEQEGLDASVLE